MTFSIIVTSHNQHDFIRQAVDSALVQRPDDSEVIVIDDGSRDGSGDLLDRYGPSIRLVKLAWNGGAIAARNHGASLAQGRFLVFLDGDDVLMPWSLDVYAKVIAARSPILILGRTKRVHGEISPADNDKTPRQAEFVEYEGLFMKDRAAGLCASSYVVEREAFWQAGGWSSGIFQLDLQDLSTKLGCSGKLILMCAPPTAFYRIHSSNSILDVRPFLTNIYRLLEKERAGEYPGGSGYIFRRRAWFGGLVAFWVKRAAFAGLRKDAIRLALSGWMMLIASIILRAKAIIFGRRPIQKIELV